MPVIYTRKGDQGTTTLRTGPRRSKYDVIIETIGALDEADASIGLARSIQKDPAVADALLHIQKDLHDVMADVAVDPEHPQKTRATIGKDHLLWLEDQVDYFAQDVQIPDYFIVPGDTYPAAVLDMARAVVRRAERRMVELKEKAGMPNAFLLQYVNRLSSLLYTLELRELSRHNIPNDESEK
jgi:cob(I)alamin adenosyltransferase